MTTKEQDFKNRLLAVLKDLQQSGSRDADAMWLLGSLASDLADDLESRDWSSAKARLDRQTYDTLLLALQDQGNEHHREGRIKHAYAIQVLALSLIAVTQNDDPHVASGEELLDEIVDRATSLYRDERASRAN